MSASPTTSARPSHVGREQLLTFGPFLVLGAWTLLVAVVLARLAVDNHYVFRDEANAIVLGRVISHDLAQAYSGSIARGPERMTSLFAGVAALLTDGPTRQVELLHLWAAVCQALVTIPVWLAARQLGLGRWQALVPATIASSGSFAFFGVFTLNAAIGALTAALLLWAMTRALARPGLLSDALVIVTTGLLALSRIGWVELAAALVPAVLAAVWWERPAGESVGRWFAQLPRRLLRRHPLLTPLGVLVLFVAIVEGPSVLLGGKLYGGSRLNPHVELSVLWDNTRILGAHLAIGTALVPFVLALPLLARDLVRPAEPREGAFAWLVLAFVLIFSYAYYYTVNEDRYFAVLVPPLALAAALAVFRRPPPVWSVLVSGALVAALVATSYTWPVQDVFTYFIAPTSRFFGDVVVGKLTQHLPGPSGFYAALAAAVAGLAAAFVVLARRRPAQLGRLGVVGGGVVLAGVLVFQLAAMDHPARKFVRLAGMSDVDAAQLEVLDREGGGATVRPLAVDGVIDPVLAAQLQLFEAYDSSLSLTPFAVRRDPHAAPVPGLLTIDRQNGAIATPDPPALVLQFAGAAQVGIAGELLPVRPPFTFAQLVRPSTPLRATWVIRGTGSDRYPLANVPVAVRAFPTHAADRCLSGVLFAHPFATAPVPFHLTLDGRTRVRGVLQPNAPRPFSLPLSAARPTDIVLIGRARRLTDGTTRGPTVFNLGVAPCRGR